VQSKKAEATSEVMDKRVYPRLSASFKVRFGVCGGHGREVPGFTNNVSLGGVRFISPDTGAKVGDHLAVEISIPGFDEPLYFLGEVLRVQKNPAGTEIACRFDWLGKSDRYKDKLAALISAHVDT
jgi:hypothetical protein